MIATTAFEKAAEAQARSLGFEPGIVYVPHPIQDRTDEEIRAIAEAAFDDVLAMITSA
jgi:alkanesulfonate monooxygenase SsuD/methylene tetrahydromethanopterin reductase-like flavin-dependent oxidoreductase (luciferase family)